MRALDSDEIVQAGLDREPGGRGAGGERWHETVLGVSRALVYGLLTAILAGLYAATVGLMQRLMVGLVGKNSDAAVIVTTLIVVSAFTPVKNRLQRLVDRRFRDSGNPAAVLGAYTNQLAEGSWTVERNRALRRFVRLVSEAYGAAGATVRVQEAAGSVRSASFGLNDRPPSLTVSTGSGPIMIVTTLTDLDGYHPRREADRATLTTASAAFAAELTAEV